MYVWKYTRGGIEKLNEIKEECKKYFFVIIFLVLIFVKYKNIFLGNTKVIYIS